ncbi:hypothetical protein NC652_011516 [Populus alba x Populus x berolinensis]|nr:hypothetical protein NC652_011516 [Populus alba x Populus x berolinensis]
MGNTCNSCESTSVVTAKLVFEDGKLQEFSYSIRVSQIIQRNPKCFVCKAGCLYFALPSSWLNNPLSTEQMVALAVKANSALKMGARAGFCWCGMKKVDPAIEWRSKSPSDETIPMVATGTHSDGGGFVAERRGKSGGRERKSTTRLTPRLSAILEE